MDFMAVCYMSQIPVNSLCNANVALKISDIQITLKTQAESLDEKQCPMGWNLSIYRGNLFPFSLASIFFLLLTIWNFNKNINLAILERYLLIIINCDESSYLCITVLMYLIYDGEGGSMWTFIWMVYFGYCNNGWPAHMYWKEAVFIHRPCAREKVWKGSPKWSLP